MTSQEYTTGIQLQSAAGDPLGCCNCKRFSPDGCTSTQPVRPIAEHFKARGVTCFDFRRRWSMKTLKGGNPWPTILS